jgi:phage terminase large subunit GpA-like protein
MTAAYGSAWPLARQAAIAFRPPKRMSVCEGVQESLIIRQPGGYSGPWDPREAPYMVEPTNMLSSRQHEAVCFVGPARTGKTMALIDGWVARNITCDPGDMLVVQMSQDKAREFSRTRVDRMLRHSPLLAELTTGRGHDDNTHDKLFKHGMWLKIGWPSATQLSSSDYRYVAMTDYDRWPENIEGEGPGFALGRKRTTTFLSRGMAAVESSPRYDIEDPGWVPSSPHEAPPVSGILGIYNSSDRRRWYWKCPDCGEYFEAKPGLDLFSALPTQDELQDLVRKEDLETFSKEHAKVGCPHCGALHGPEMKPVLNSLDTARWVTDGQTISKDGELQGTALTSSIAGYWLGGVAASYQKWDGLILRHLQGLREYVMAGSELTLKATCNLDQGMAYTPQYLVQDSEGRVEDRLEDTEQYFVPNEARFLVATVDVQGGRDGRFVGEVRAFGPHLESWLVDRFVIRYTTRHGAQAQVDPAGFPEDWDLLNERVLNATYRTEHGMELRVLRVGVDTGGEAGTSANAYAWYRRLRKKRATSRVFLLKGASSKRPDKPMVKGHARTNASKPMRDMPVWTIDTHYYKDVIAASLRRNEPGPGYFHPPRWVSANYFEELRAEVRMPDGKWKQVRARNEAIDLWVYALAICEALGYGAKGKLDWENPPPWAQPLESNSELVAPGQRRVEQQLRKKPRKRKSGPGLASGDWKSRL